jgi:hypothetical protein
MAEAPEPLSGYLYSVLLLADNPCAPLKLKFLPPYLVQKYVLWRVVIGLVILLQERSNG